MFIQSVKDFSDKELYPYFQEMDADPARYYRARPETALHRAYVASQLSAYAISRNQPREALFHLVPHIETAQRHENAALLATLLMLRAEALALDGQVTEARAVRLDSLGWARYGFGSDWEVRARLREISALSPLERSADGI